MDIDAQSNEAFIEFIDDPSKEVEICVTQCVSRQSGFSAHVAYIIKVNNPVKISAERRYRQFDALRDALLLRWPGVFIPILPPKHSTGSSSIKVVNQRIKYLSYFLNCVAKVKYLFMSEQFQLFLNSNSSDMKKMFEKTQKMTYESIALRYEKIFPEIRPNLDEKAELMAKVNDIVVPFYNQLKETENSLVIFKKDLYRLAVKKEEYLRSMGDLYSDALPEFQKYMGDTCEKAALILLNNEASRKKIAQVKVSKAESYWIIYEAIRLQILETRAVIEIIHNRQIIEREEERIRKRQ